jgi:hypothetical protein
MNRKKLYTTKDFREGRIAIKFNGNRQLLKDILLECSDLKEHHIDSVCQNIISGYNVIFFAGSNLFVDVSTSFYTRHGSKCVSELDVFLVKSKKPNFIQRLICKFTK